MRLSEAIEAGAKQTPQAFGGFWNIQTNATCAIGAAWLGRYGVPSASPMIGKLYAACGVNGQQITAIYAAPDGQRGSLTEIIYHLNDKLKMSREDIAHWLWERGL